MPAHTGEDIALVLNDTFCGLVEQQPHGRIDPDVIWKALLIFSATVLFSFSKSADLSARQEADLLRTFAQELEQSILSIHQAADNEQH